MSGDFRGIFLAYVLGLLVTLFGCGGSVRPVTYGMALAACTETSQTEQAAKLCCVDVARSYGRDPAFCLAPVTHKDGGSVAEFVADAGLVDPYAKDASPHVEDGGRDE